MPDPGERDGVVVLGDDQVVLGDEVEHGVLEHVRVDGSPGDLLLSTPAEGVDGDELFVEVVEGRPGRSEPVLEDRDVGHEGVQSEHPVGGVDGEGDVVAMFLGCEGARRGELVLAAGAIDEVTPGEDEVVEAAEEGRPPTPRPTAPSALGSTGGVGRGRIPPGVDR